MRNSVIEFINQRTMSMKGGLTLEQLPILLYETAKENTYVDVYFKDETFWMSQKMMADLFEVGVPAISKHLQNIYSEEELELSSTVSRMEIVRLEGTRQVKRAVDFYNLDAIIAVGYRVNSKQATRFRQWATKTLKEFITKGFPLKKIFAIIKSDGFN